MLADPVSKDELKLKAAQELSENFEVSIRPYTVKLHTFSLSLFLFFFKSRLNVFLILAMLHYYR